MTEYKKKLFEVLSDNTYGLCPAPMSSDVALQILVNYLLGENFYIVMPLSQEQANTEIVAAILDKYSKEYKKDRKKFMKEKGGDTIMDCPTADFVEVVRCKDCAIPHNQWTGCPKLNGLVTPPDFYCSYGERR